MDWYPWYFQIYESDTMHLNPYQDGCYRRLIDHYMKTRCALPDNDAALARIVGDSEANWVAIASPLIRPFFKAKDGLLYLHRCEIVLAQQDERRKSLSESGKNGAKKRWNKVNEINETDGHPIATPMGTLKPNDSTGQDRTGHITPIVPLTGGATKVSKRGCRIPDDWDCSSDLGKWAMTQGLSRPEVLHEIEQFTDHYRTATGKGSTALDWDLKFRTWIRNTVKWQSSKTSR
jgi:uncharacterized protein YdaU (DUF1376 family)